MTSLIEGKYEILSKLKEGGMGAIYKVRHVLLDEVRVIKVMRPQIEDDPDAQRRFQAEARMATSLKHPNIAALLDFAEDKDHTFYMVMEFIDGANLAEFSAKNGPPPLPVALEIGIQTLEALGYLHKRGIIHRDISPENIMLTHDPEGRVIVKLIDLGVAKQTGSQGMTVTGMFVGKLKYGSPEQLGVLKANEKIDGRSDIYSLGCVLYQMLTGQSAFNAESMQAYVMAHLMHPPRPFEETDPEGKVPEEVRQAVLRALAKSRDDRWATAEEFAHALADARDDMGTKAADEDTAAMADLMRLAAQRSGVQQKPSGISEAEARLARAFATPTPSPHGAGSGTPRPGTLRTTTRPAPAVREATPRPAPLEPPPFEAGPATSRTVVSSARREDDVFQPTARTVISSAPAPAPSAEVATPAPPMPHTAFKAGGSRARLWAVAGTAVGVLILIGVFVLGRDRAPAADPAPASTGAAAPGALLLTAEPWATVVNVKDAAGNAIPVGEVVTPARLSLPPGEYTITVRGEAPGSETVSRVEVAAGADVPLHVVIPGFDVDQAVQGYVR